MYFEHEIQPMPPHWKLRLGQDRKDKDLKLVDLWKISCTLLLSNKLKSISSCIPLDG